MLAYAATGGAEGVVGINDCKVSALAVPGTSVRVSTGGIVALNRSTGGGQQSYIMRNTSETEVPIVATGGATRYDLIVARVEDPQYPPWSPPADPVVGPYVNIVAITNVPASTTSAAQLALGYPAVALARLAIPASTATITGAMITDLRKVPKPRRHRELRTYALSGADTDSITTNAADGERWPDVAWTMDIPEWATAANVLAFWNGVRVPANSNYFGSIWAKIGTQVTQTSAWEAGTISTVQRLGFAAADDITIPSAMRGTTQTVELRARWAGGTVNFVYLDQYSSISLDVEFVERADLV